MFSCDQLAEEENEQRRRQEQMLLEKMEQEEQQEENTKVRFRPELYSSLLHSSISLHRSTEAHLRAAVWRRHYSFLLLSVLISQSPSHRGKRQQQELITELRRRQGKDNRHVYEGKDGAIEDIITGKCVLVSDKCIQEALLHRQLVVYVLLSSISLVLILLWTVLVFVLHDQTAVYLTRFTPTGIPFFNHHLSQVSRVHPSPLLALPFLSPPLPNSGESLLCFSQSLAHTITPTLLWWSQHSFLCVFDLICRPKFQSCFLKVFLFSIFHPQP